MVCGSLFNTLEGFCTAFAFKDRLLTGDPHFSRNQAKQRPGRKNRQVAPVFDFSSRTAAGMGHTLKIKYSEV